MRIKQTERALVFKGGKLTDILDPGQRNLKGLLPNHELRVHSVSVPELFDESVTQLLADKPAFAEDYFSYAELGDDEIGLLYFDGLLTEVLGPGTRRIYWKVMRDIRIERIKPAETPQVPQKLIPAVARLNSANIQNLLVWDYEDCYLFRNGQLVEKLAPGRYAFWVGFGELAFQKADRRVQTLTVNGQELLTSDRIGLRVNLDVAFRITDSRKMLDKASDWKNQIYLAAQGAIRQVIGRSDLDSLLERNAENEAEILRLLKQAAGEIGITIDQATLKDLILPGEMRGIMNKVIAAEKQAQANAIRRREETAETRSMLNTARLMENNPVLLRLKELEALEQVVDKVGQLNVYNGLTGVVDDLVSLRAPKGN